MKEGVNLLGGLLLLVVMLVIFFIVFCWTVASYNTNKTLSERKVMILKREINDLNIKSAALDKLSDQSKTNHSDYFSPGLTASPLPATSKESRRRDIQREIFEKKIKIKQVTGFWELIPPVPIIIMGVIGIVITRILNFVIDASLRQIPAIWKKILKWYKSL